MYLQPAKMLDEEILFVVEVVFLIIFQKNVLPVFVWYLILKVEIPLFSVIEFGLVPLRTLTPVQIHCQ